MRRMAGRWVAGALLIALVSACDNDPTGSGDDRRRDAGPSPESTGDALAIRRVDLDIRASGAFRPGAPIVVTSNAKARYGSDVEHRLVVLDTEEPAGEDAPPVRSAATFRGAMGRGNARQLTATVTFPRAGYYRIVATTRAEPSPDDPRVLAGDTILMEGSSETLYVLVDEQGGRITTSFDPAALAGRQPLFGSFGPFVDATPRPTGVPGARDPSLPVAGANVQRGMFWYWHEVAGAHRPVPGAAIDVQCVDASRRVLSTYSTATASDGSFSITCSTGLYSATIHLRNRIANVVNPNGSSAGVSFTESVGTNPSLQANNYYAGRVFTLLSRYVPIAEGRFSLARTQIKVFVSPDNTDTRTNYFQTEDVIRQHYAKVFHEYGTFVTVHEYAHAYHWGAIEPPASYSCSATNEHNITGQYNFNCAFVEGFADFFAFWVAGDSLVNSGSSDYAVERQDWYRNADGTLKDGAQVEGAVAGFLYDLVDGPGDPDGYTNTPMETESFDAVTYPGSFIALTMRDCTLSTSTTTYRDLFGSDDLVYCLENSLTAKADAATFGSPWYSYTSVQRTAAPPSGFSSTAVRRLWRANFYGAM